MLAPHALSPSLPVRPEYFGDTPSPRSTPVRSAMIATPVHVTGASGDWVLAITAWTTDKSRTEPAGGLPHIGSHRSAHGFPPDGYSFSRGVNPPPSCTAYAAAVPITCAAKRLLLNRWRFAVPAARRYVEANRVAPPYVQTQCFQRPSVHNRQESAVRDLWRICVFFAEVTAAHRLICPGSPPPGSAESSLLVHDGFPSAQH